MRSLRYCVYILFFPSDHGLYIGYSASLRRRLKQHREQRSRMTAGRGPFELLHCEYFLSKTDALRREAYLKTENGWRILQLTISEALDMKGALKACREC